jgi:dipeptidyl aminopeptidase/acylaminoacyl peptidase
MHKASSVLAIALLFLLAASAAAQTQPQPDGTIVERTACAPWPTSSYEQYVEFRKRAMAAEVEAAKSEGFRIAMPTDLTRLMQSREVYEKRRAYEGFECQRVKYLSDGLKVVGYIWKPKDTAGKKFPLIIFNRGGNQEFGKLLPHFYSGFYEYLANGFVVVASQYRGNDGGEGKEEFGGADVRDVLNLVPLAKSLGYVDTNNIFMYGASRGGMMTFLALKHGLRVNAAAVVGGLADLTTTQAERPLLVGEVYKQLIPDFDKRGAEAMRERSAVYWPEKITAPLLILQGGADWRVNTKTNALALAQKLHDAGKTYELIVYAGDDHGLSANARDVERRVVDWFKRHLK